MRNTSNDTISNVARLLDLGALVVAFALSAWLAAGDARDMPFTDVLALRIKLQNFVLFIAMVGTWSVMLGYLGLYRTYIYRSRGRELRDVVTATVCSKWAESEPSSVTTVHLSSSVRISAPPTFTIGSIAIVIPETSRGPRFGLP